MLEMNPSFPDLFPRVRWLRLAGALLVGIAILSGCAATVPVATGPGAVEEGIREADVELAKGQREKAVAMLTQLARDNPTSITPWLRMANIWFEAANYPSSILAANEALQRDAANQEAKSLLVVAGLRVAAGALAELRPNPAIGTNARMEAESVTNSLRTILGEKVLVPGAAADDRPAAPPARSRTRKRAPKIPVFTPEDGGQDPAARKSSDPFKSLK